MRLFPIFLALIAPAFLAANKSGLPVGHTGGFGEPTCSQCHRLAPLPGPRDAKVRIEVGPYTPGERQSVRVVIDAVSQISGFQVTARPESSPNTPAGVFEQGNTTFAQIRCSDGSFAPCDPGEIQYATHSSAGASRSGQPGRQIFTFDWIPPASDVGPVRFAGAAVAADNDGGTNGDATMTTSTVSLYAPANQPRIDLGGVTGAAAPQRSPTVISALQLISIFGANLAAPGASFSTAQADFDSQGLLPRDFNRLSVRFNVPNSPSDFWGRFIFVSEGQANLQAPALPDGAETATLRAVMNRGQGAAEVVGPSVQVAVARSAPGLFTFGGGSTPWNFGEGPAAAVDAASGRIVAPAAVGVPNSKLAQVGDVILLYGTGFGATSPQPAAGAIVEGAAPLVRGVTIEIGGMIAEQFYAGAAPGFAGLTQFNVRIPQLPAGRHEVVIRQGSFSTQTGVFVELGP